MTLHHRINRKIRVVLRDAIRQRLRKKVAFSAPSPPVDGSVSFSTHLLMCHQDFLMAICSAKCLNLAAQCALPWFFHDDGSLTDLDKALLNRHFPGCKVVERREADAFFDLNKGKYPVIAECRRKHVMLLKLADISAFSKKERLLNTDSDVLFFRRPDFILTKLQDVSAGNYFNRDIDSAYIADRLAIKQLTGTEPLEKINAGLSVLSRKDISLEKIEVVLRQLDVRLRTDWVHYSHLIEQTCAAVLTGSSPGGAFHLPTEYDVSLTKPVADAVCKHYVGVIRHEYEIEGLRLLLGPLSFMEKWRTFVREA